MLDNARYPGFGNGDLGSRAPGPYDVTRAAYDFGDQAYQPAGLGGRVELRADVHSPTDLSAGPYPLVLFLHGNHAACYRGDRAGYSWPCPDGWKPLPNYEGYDYIAKRPASYGYIVASVSGGGVNVLGNEVPDTGMRQRGLLLEKHFDLWNTWNTVGGDPFGTTFVGAVDMSRTGVMGHLAAVRAPSGTPSSTNSARFPTDSTRPRAAPVDFTRVTVNNVALGVMLPDCDGDVSDLQGIHYFDDSRYAVPATRPQGDRHRVQGEPQLLQHGVVAILGLPRLVQRRLQLPRQLTETAQRRVGAAYIVSFFRRFIGGESAPGELWTGERPLGRSRPRTRP
jgi:hypothetical protein